mgnify:CR=1 FL=1
MFFFCFYFFKNILEKNSIFNVVVVWRSSNQIIFFFLQNWPFFALVFDSFKFCVCSLTWIQYWLCNCVHVCMCVCAFNINKQTKQDIEFRKKKKKKILDKIRFKNACHAYRSSSSSIPKLIIYDIRNWSTVLYRNKQTEKNEI